MYECIDFHSTWKYVAILYDSGEELRGGGGGGEGRM